MKLNRIVALALACTFVFAFGCKKSPEEAGKEAVKEVKVAAEPDKVVLQAVEAVKNNKPVEVYAMLPASYQKDIQGLVTDFTGKLDKELFDLSVKVLDKGMACIDKHGDKLKAEMGKGAPMDLGQGFQMAKDIHGMLKDAKITDYDALKKLDVAAFLGSHGAKMMKYGMDVFKTMEPKDYDQFQQMIGKVDVKVLKNEKDTAELEITIGGDKEKVTLKKVEDRWVPAEMADGWKGMMAEAKKEMGGMAEEMTKNKAEAKAMLEQVLAALTEFEKDGNMEKLAPLMKGF